MGNTLDTPNTAKESEIYESSSGIQVGQLEIIDLSQALRNYDG